MLSDFIFQLGGSFVIGLACLSIYFAVAKKSPFNAFVAGFILALRGLLLSLSHFRDVAQITAFASCSFLRRCDREYTCCPALVGQTS